MRLLRLTPLFLVAIVFALLQGCVRGPMWIAPANRKVIDRSVIDYPGGFVLKVVLHNLTAPCDIAQDAAGNLIVLESGRGGYSPRILCFHPDGSVNTIYPARPDFSELEPFDFFNSGYKIYGPCGGLAIANGKIYISHRDKNGFGVVTAFGYDGSHTTISSSIPAQGDNGMSDIAVSPIDGRIWFAVGSATNSGVVGLDNWPWVKQYPDFCDKSFFDLKLNGYQFKSKNPDSGIFGGSDIAVTAPFEPFNVSTQTRILKVEFPTGAIYSADPNGGSAKVEATGIHAPRGLAFNEFKGLYFTANGMELRGTRPIVDDPDALLKFSKDGWYGYPDFSTDLQPITESRFQPRGDMVKLLIKSGYPEISNLFDHSASRDREGLMAPLRDTLLQATFPSLSGAGNFDFVPSGGPFHEFDGDAIIPLSGDRAPFATSGQKLNEPVGYEVVRVDPSTRDVIDFIRNARGGPASNLPSGQGLLERPTAVKFGADGKLYIVDGGEVDHKNPIEKIRAGSGKVFVLEPLAPATTAATTKPSTGEHPEK